MPFDEKWMNLSEKRAATILWVILRRSFLLEITPLKEYAKGCLSQS
jgi:hypothetical protein